MTRFKRITATGMSAVLLLSLTACSFKPVDTIKNLFKKGGNDSLAQVSEVNKDAVFKETERFDIGFNYINNIISVDGKYYAVNVRYDYPEYDPEMNGFETEDPELYLNSSSPAMLETEGGENETADDETIDDTDSDYTYEGEDYYYDPGKAFLQLATFTNGSDVQKVEIEIPSDMSVVSNGLGVDKAGNVYIAAEQYIYDDMNPSDKWYLKKYDASLNELASIEINMGDDWGYIEGMVTDPDGFTYLITGISIDVYDPDLKLIGQSSISTENGWYAGPFMFNKEAYVGVSDYSRDDFSFNISKIEKNGTLTKNDQVSSIIETSNFISGEGYDVYYRNATSIIGVDVANQEKVEVVNFFDSDINPNNLDTVYFSDKDKFVTTGWTDTGCEVVVYEKVPADQVVDKEIITLGTTYLNFDVTEQIMKFNKESDKYKIKVVCYGDYNTEEDWTLGYTRFNTDLVGGNACDIIVADGLNVTNLIQKNVFMDLSPFMENSTTLTKDDLTDNVKQLYGDGEKLYCIFPGYQITAYQLKDEFYKENMTLGDVIAWENEHHTKAFFQTTKEGILYNAIEGCINEFVDVETGKCSFDSEEFVKLLEYINTYPESYDDEVYNDEHWYDEYMNTYRNDTSLFNICWFSNIRDYNWTEAYRFGTSTSLTGFPLNGNTQPTMTPSTIIGISAKSKNSEAAWEFISSIFEEDSPVYTNNYSIPSLKSALDTMVEEAQERPYWVDENGNKEYYDETVWIVDHEEVIPPMTKEEAEAIKAFVLSVNTTSEMSSDTGLTDIINEEAGAFFSGQKSASEVAQVIQSRVQIYVNEKR